jgi:hypothetical protein
MDHYSHGGHWNVRQDPRVRPFVLTESERTDMIAFLSSLTDRDFLKNPRFQPP